MPETLPRRKHNSSRGKGRNSPALPVLHLLTLDTLPVKGSDRKVFMRSSFYRLSLLSVLTTLSLIATSCEEDVRYSGQTQYLGGVHGGAPTTGAPTDSVSYWDGDHIGGKPSVKISLKEQRAYLYKSGPMPYFMRIVDCVGMHAGYLPGYPASHGCIRMPQFMAENFFKSLSTGTPVTITN